MRRSRQIIKEQYRNKIKNYIQCKKCLQLFTTHAQMSSSKGDYHNMKSVEIDEKVYFELPASEIDNIKILGQNVGEIINWKILCSNCKNCLGVLSNNLIFFAQKSVKITTIKYEALDKFPLQSSPQTQKTLKTQKYRNLGPKDSTQTNRLYKKLQKYYSLQFNRCQKKLINIEINTQHIEVLQKQLRSFLKFYQKWTQHKRIKQNNNSSYQSFKNNSTSH